MTGAATDPARGRVLVTGAAGMLGQLILRELLTRGIDAVGLVRDPGVDIGAPAVVGDLLLRRSLIASMSGVSQLLVITPAAREQPTMYRNLLAAADEVGTTRIVHISTSDAFPGSPVPWADAPAHADVQLRARAGSTAILRPAAYALDVLADRWLLDRGLLLQCAGEATVAWVDPADVAACAAVVVAEGRSGEFLLTGPQALSYAAVARVLGHALGRRVRYVEVPAVVMRLLLRFRGTPAWRADGLVSQFAHVVKTGRDPGGTVSADVATLLGRPPRTLAEFLQAHLHDGS